MAPDPTLIPIDLEDDEDLLPVPLDRDTRRWLVELAQATGNPPARLVATMLAEIRTDDEAAHRLH